MWEGEEEVCGEQNQTKWVGSRQVAGLEKEGRKGGRARGRKGKREREGGTKGERGRDGGREGGREGRRSKRSHHVYTLTCTSKLIPMLCRASTSSSAL